VYAYSLFEAADCGYLCIVYIEDGQQFGYLQDFMEFSAQVADADGCTLSFGAE
jgi:hypothetical protein